MAAQPSDPEIEKLLAEVVSDDNERCIAALEKIAERKINNAKIIRTIKTLAHSDTDTTVRHKAELALIANGAEISRQAKVVQFAIGFVGWFILNYVAWNFVLGLARRPVECYISCLGPALAQAFAAIALGLLIIVSTMIVLIVLARLRRWAALGMLGAVVVNFLFYSVANGIPGGGLLFSPFFMPFFVHGLP